MWWSFSKVETLGCFLFYSFPAGPQSGAIPWVAPGDPWTPQWSLALSLIPLIIPAAPDRSPLASGSCGIYSVQWHRWHGHSVAWCQWQVEARIPACLATASGRRREKRQSELRAIEAAAGNQRLSGQFLREPRPARSSPESNGGDPASAGTRSLEKKTSRNQDRFRNQYDPSSRKTIVI